jgi:hypothetical protein
MFRLDLAVGFFFLLGSLQDLELAFGQDQVLGCHLGFQGL